MQFMTSMNSDFDPAAERDEGPRYSDAWAQRIRKKMRPGQAATGVGSRPQVSGRAKNRALLTSTRAMHGYAPASPRTAPIRAAAASGDLQNGPGLVPAHMRGRLGIGAALESKACANRVYREFVTAVIAACSSPAAERLEISAYSLDEKRDLENPSWLKMILDIDFVDGDFDSKRERRIILRGMLNERIRAAKLRSATPERFDEIIGRFFIIVKW